MAEEIRGAVEAAGEDFYPTRPLPAKSELREVGEDLTVQVKDWDPGDISAREGELRLVMKVLGRRTKGNPIVLGEAGVGKTFLVKCLAWKIVHGEVPDWLAGRKIVRTSFHEISAAASKSPETYWGYFIRKLKAVLDEAMANPIVLFMDEIHQVFVYPQTMNVVKPYLADGSLRVIGATTNREYMRYLSRDDAVARRFQPVQLAEPHGHQLTAILSSEQAKLEQLYSAKAEPDVVSLVLRLSGEYMPYRAQPDKAIDVLEQAFVECRVSARDRLTAADVRQVVAEMTGIPSEDIASEKEKTLGLELALNHRVLGQEEAIAAVCRRLRVTRSRVQVNPERPLGVFLVTGPSGVGKTELARALARHFTGSEENLARLDMSIYKTADSLTTMLGAPVRTDGEHMPEVPKLTHMLRKSPYCVLLLDEVDKADHEVMDLFLQAFDYGRMMDYQGNDLVFRNVLVIMTCNVGFSPGETKPRGELGFGKAASVTWAAERSRVMAEVGKVFRPEFLGRVDEVLVFKPLTPEVMDGFIGQKVVQLEQFTGKKLRVEAAVRELIRARGFDPVMGARPLNRAFDEVVGQSLATLKMTPAWEGAGRIAVSIENGVPAARVEE